MTAGKNQAQPIILNAVLFIGAFRRTRLRFEMSHELVLRRIKSCPSTQSIDGLESGRRNQPWSRVIRYSTLRPQAQRSRKGFVHGLLGKIKITEQADQSCQNSSRIHAIKGVEQFAYRIIDAHHWAFSKSHALCNDANERNADRVARLLKEKKNSLVPGTGGPKAGRARIDWPTVRLRTEGLGLSTERFRRNIGVLRRFCRHASGNPKTDTTFLLRSPKTEKEQSLTN